MIRRIGAARQTLADSWRQVPQTKQYPYDWITR